jgi:hypothetical protein
VTSLGAVLVLGLVLALAFYFLTGLSVVLGVLL